MGSDPGAELQDLKWLWAVQGGEGDLDDVTLHRWLQAENYNVDAAEKRLRAHAIWRKEEFPEGRVLEVAAKSPLLSFLPLVASTLIIWSFALRWGRGEWT